MTILALISTKGGSGKTTAAASIAAEYAHRGRRVALLDTDPQETLTEWHGAGGPLSQIPLETAHGDAVEARLLALKAAHDLVIVDTPGFRNADLFTVLEHADIALLPVRTRSPDARAAIKTLELVHQVNATVERRGRPVRIALLLNTEDRSVISAQVRSDIEQLGETVLRAGLPQLVAFTEADALGSAPRWMGRSAAPAADAIAAVVDELNA